MFLHTSCVLHHPTADLFRFLWRSKALCRSFRTVGATHGSFQTVNCPAFCNHSKNNYSTICRTRTSAKCLQPYTYSAIFQTSDLLLPLQKCQVRTYATKQQKGLKHKSERKRKPVEKKQVVEITPEMTVNQLAVAMGGDKDGLVDFLFRNGVIPTRYYNAKLKKEQIIQILQLMKMSYHLTSKPEPEDLFAPVPEKKKNLDAMRRPPPDPSVLTDRPPVVTIMGHVDHGKTTLLDTLRKTSVAAGEAGGITQHIGAFLVELESKHQITFLDTPGHAAFSAMRERGANVTDIVVLVVAADDSVMEQTKESIRFAQNAKVPILVAINKCDRPNADPELTKMDLMSHGIHLEEMGGDVQCVEISALKGTNIDALMEAIITQAEVQEIMGDPTGLVEAVVVESKVDKGKGPIATVIIQRGTLQRGAILVAGKCTCRVRAMFNEHDQQIQTAPPGMPVEVTGWRGTPSAGDDVLQVQSDSRAREVLKWRQDQDDQTKLDELAIHMEKEAATRERKHYATHDERFAIIRSRRGKVNVKEKELVASEEPELNIVIKGDVDGSVEAILNTLSTYDAHDQCKLNILQYGVGNITAKDVETAQTFSGVVIGFNVTASLDALKLAQESDVPLMLHNIIYRLMDDVRENCTSRLPPIKEEVVVGEASVQMPFQVTVGTKKVPIAGCKVIKGTLSSSGMYKLIRHDDVVAEGPIASLKHKKDDVASVNKDMECGIRLKKIVDYQVGDIIRCFKEESVPQELNWTVGF